MSDALMEDMISVALKWNKQIIIGKSQKQSLAAICTYLFWMELIKFLSSMCHYRSVVDRRVKKAELQIPTNQFEWFLGSYSAL